MLVWSGPVLGTCDLIVVRSHSGPWGTDHEGVSSRYRKCCIFFYFLSSYKVNEARRGMFTDEVFNTSTWIPAVNYKAFLVSVLVGNTTVLYSQFLLNAAIVLLWKRNGFVCLCLCVWGGSVCDYLHWLDRGYFTWGPRPSVVASASTRPLGHKIAGRFLCFNLIFSLVHEAETMN